MKFTSPLYHQEELDEALSLAEEGGIAEELKEAIRHWEKEDRTVELKSFIYPEIEDKLNNFLTGLYFKKGFYFLTRLFGLEVSKASFLGGANQSLFVRNRDEKNYYYELSFASDSDYSLEELEKTFEKVFGESLLDCKPYLFIKKRLVEISNLKS